MVTSKRNPLKRKIWGTHCETNQQPFELSKIIHIQTAQDKNTQYLIYISTYVYIYMVYILKLHHMYEIIYIYIYKYIYVNIPSHPIFYPGRFREHWAPVQGPDHALGRSPALRDLLIGPFGHLFVQRRAWVHGCPRRPGRPGLEGSDATTNQGTSSYEFLTVMLEIEWCEKNKNYIYITKGTDSRVSKYQGKPWKAVWQQIWSSFLQAKHIARFVAGPGLFI